MGTRGGIVRITGDGTFKGRYHHWDSHTYSLGAELWTLYRERHKKNLEAMLVELIDNHPGGWSTIVEKDWSQPPGYNEKQAPQCYCHGDRSEEGMDLTEENASGVGCEYVYAFGKENGKDIMLVLSSYVGDRKMIGMFGCGNPNAEWKVIGKIELADDTMPKILRSEDEDE
jgi:hypothetical protein